MSSRFGERDYGRFGGRDYDDDDDDERTRYAREYDRGGSYGEGTRRGHELTGRDYGSGRERDYEDFGSRDRGRGAGGYYTREYPSRFGRETTYYGGGGYAGAARGREYERGEGGVRDYGRDARDYGRDIVERGYERDAGRDRGRGGQDTDYGRTSSRFFGRDNYGRGYDRDDRDDRGRGGDEGRGWVDRAADEVRSWFGDEDAERRRRMDETRGGRYRGRGPKNYHRSDERILEEINDRLTEDDWLDATEIEVSVTGGEVVLSGEVESRSDKRYAEDIASMVSGVNNVQNNLRVRQWRGAGIPPTASTGTGGLPTTVATDETLTATPPTGTTTTGGPTSRAAKTSS